MGLTARDVYFDTEGPVIPLLIVKMMVPAGVDFDWAVSRAREAVAEAASRGAVTLGELVGAAADAARAHPEVTTSFSAVDWHDPDGWGGYTWPLKTLARYGLLERRGYAAPVYPGRSLESALLRALPRAYVGAGIVAYTEEKGFVTRSEPVAVFVDAERIPRKTLIAFWHPEEDYASVGVTALPDLAEKIAELFNGYLSVEEPIPGYPLYTVIVHGTQPRHLAGAAKRIMEGLLAMVHS